MKQSRARFEARILPPNLHMPASLRCMAALIDHEAPTPAERLQGHAYGPDPESALLELHRVFSPRAYWEYREAGLQAIADALARLEVVIQVCASANGHLRTARAA